VFRRPLTPRDVAPASAALMCLALLFPAYFLLNGEVPLLKEVTVAGRTSRRGPPADPPCRPLVSRLSRAGLGMAAKGGFWLDSDDPSARAGKGRKRGFSRVLRFL
jgi:hypothetical protein